MSGAERATLTSSSATHCRDAINVPRVPKQQWLETNTLYYDDAEGPDRIGNYNVSSATVSRFIDKSIFRYIHGKLELKIRIKMQRSVVILLMVIIL